MGLNHKTTNLTMVEVNDAHTATKKGKYKNISMKKIEKKKKESFVFSVCAGSSDFY